MQSTPSKIAAFPLRNVLTPTCLQIQEGLDESFHLDVPVKENNAVAPTPGPRRLQERQELGNQCESAE